MAKDIDKKGENDRDSDDKHSTKIPCCPEIMPGHNCDTIVFTRTLDYRGNDNQALAQLILTFRLSRCTLGFVLGDPVYSTTLFPGEKVRIATTDRRSKFTIDTSTNTSHYDVQMSEEQYFMQATQKSFTDLENSQSGKDSTYSHSSNFGGKVGGGVDLGIVSFGGGVSGSTASSSSTLDYLHQQSSTMQMAAAQSVAAAHRESSMSIGAVATRSHAQGQSEDHFESASHEYQNMNDCHAITYIFYRLNKKQVLKYELVSIRVVADHSRQFLALNQSKALIAQATEELVKAGVMDKSGKPSEESRKEYEFKMEFSLPTPGIIVKGCLDDCNTCEPGRKEALHIANERARLENELLKKQIELLEKSKEYRCCDDAVAVPPGP